MKYGSVCSGVEAATLAWDSLGWTPAWFAEIDPFPGAVLSQRWPAVNNLGDMTSLTARVLSGEIEAPDVLVGGTPCQAFSIAGLRKGLDDERGQLTLAYVALANAIDKVRKKNGQQPCITVWENVPGVLSQKDNAFGHLLSALAGESDPLQPPGKKWTRAGIVSGRRRALAWRTLDAQFFGVAQRRRRVFVVASARKGFDPGKILFELESVRRNIAPGRETRQAVASGARAGAHSGSHWDKGNNPHPTLNQSNSTSGIGLSNQEIFAQRGGGLVGAYRMAAFGQYADDETASTCKARDYKDATDLAVEFTHQHARAWAENSRAEVRLVNGDGHITGAVAAGGGKAGQSFPCILDKLAVRRLTPRECERLQGMPDDHTLIEWRGQTAEHCPDGQRYKVIGNSMAVPVMRWIGERIAIHTQ